MPPSKPLRFIHIPAKIAQREDLSPTEKLILGIVWYLTRKTKVVRANNEYIGSCIGISDRSVKNTLHKLKENGILLIKLRRNAQGKVWSREMSILIP